MNSLLSDELLQWVISYDENEIDKLLSAALDTYKINTRTDRAETVSPAECRTGTDSASGVLVTPPLFCTALEKCMYSEMK